MRQFARMLVTRFIGLILTLSCLTGGIARAADGIVRFTQALSVPERAECGVNRLTSDQAAVLDALVRREAGSRVAASAESTTATKPFSKRLTADERRLTGMNGLSATEITKLDALIERHANANVARTLLAPPVYIRRSAPVEPVEKDDRRQIHGTFSLSYGWGKGGYSERTGAMMMNYDDPAGRYSIAIGYSETHVKLPEGQGVYLEGPPFRP
ncbi:MAG: hypothetical protein Q7S40_01460 [Opitutaceae bacterium]|nr:hypothetical protein [Opitutaceae bacterium]